MNTLDLPSIFAGADGPFERAFAALATDTRAKLTLQGIQRDLALFNGPEHAVALLRYAGVRSDLERKIAALAQIAEQRPVEIGLIGGPEDAYTLLQAGTSGARGHRIQSYALADGARTLWKSGDHSMYGAPLEKQLSAIAEGRTPAPDWRKVEERLHSDGARVEKERQEIAELQQRMSGRKPTATLVLLAVIAFSFVLELKFGALGDGEVMYRMGALQGQSVFAGQWWRLFSCAFLHGSFLHVFLNGYVLYALGSSIERIMGSARFLILYVVSAVGGSLASATLHPSGTSVGASGALWGLLAAGAVLGFRPRGMIPDSVASQMKKTALANLVLNALISFSPQIDMSAHFGGGAIGALLMFSGLLSIGIKERLTPTWMKLVAGALAAGLFGGFARALLAFA